MSQSLCAADGHSGLDVDDEHLELPVASHEVKPVIVEATASGWQELSRCAARLACTSSLAMHGQSCTTQQAAHLIRTGFLLLWQ